MFEFSVPRSLYTIMMRHSERKTLLQKLIYNAKSYASAGMLCSTGWFCTDVLGLHISPIFKGQDVFLDSLTLEDGTNM